MLDNRIRRVGISGSYGGFNLGDEAILQVIMRELQQSLPGEITVFSRDADDTHARHRVNAVSPRKLSRREARTLIGSLDLLILGGGGILYDADADMFLREVTLAHEVGTPVMVYAVSAGPLFDEPLRARVREALERAAVITVRDRQTRKLFEEIGLDNAQLNPGLGRVSPLCHEPRVALLAIYELFTPYLASGRLEIRLRCRAVASHVDGDRVRAVTLRDEAGGDSTLEAPYVLDATPLGDMLELAGVEHVVGAGSQSQTGEPHALPGAPDPLDQQAITACFALDYLPEEDHTIDRPADYDFWRSYRADFWPGPQLGWTFVDPVTLEVRRQAIFEKPGHEDLWTFRRIFYRGHFPPGRYASDITLVNWPQNDYWLGPLVGVSPEQRAAHERAARQLSLSLLYWMQTEAPRVDGGTGYRGLRLRKDVVGTLDGTAMHVYVRESRRIRVLADPQVAARRASARRGRGDDGISRASRAR